MDLFPKLLHVLVTVDVNHFTLTLQVIGRSVRLFLG